MKVQTRLSLYSSLVFVVVFAILSFLIYALFYKNMERSIYSNLEQASLITAYFHLEEDELNKEDFENIRNQFKQLVLNDHYQIYNIHNEITWGESSSIIADETLDKIREKRKFAFVDSDFFCYGIYYEDNQGDFVVIAKEKKSVLSSQVMSLLWILGGLFIVGVLAIIALSKWISYIAYRPFRRIIDQVKSISTNNLNVEIESPDTHDELQDLTETFNELLKRISEAVVIQKNFVSYVSHEFKTPLASMLGNLEVFSIKNRTSEEYKELAQKLIREIHQVEEILDTLIIVSDLRKDSEIISSTRIDELIWEIICKINDRYPSSKILVNMDIAVEDESLLFVHMDATQLLLALFNLIENAVKYSQGNTVNISLYKKENKLHVSIIDKGIGIPPEQLVDVSKPFYRADNTNQIQGSGIGLSIALRIIEKNAIKYIIESKENIGTKILLIFDSKNR